MRTRILAAVMVILMIVPVIGLAEAVSLTDGGQGITVSVVDDGGEIEIDDYDVPLGISLEGSAEETNLLHVALFSVAGALACVYGAVLAIRFAGNRKLEKQLKDQPGPDDEAMTGEGCPA